jgi:hypothetical protein
MGVVDILRLIAMAFLGALGDLDDDFIAIGGCPD